MLKLLYSSQGYYSLLAEHLGPSSVEHQIQKDKEDEIKSIIRKMASETGDEYKKAIDRYNELQTEPNNPQYAYSMVILPVDIIGPILESSRFPGHCVVVCPEDNQYIIKAEMEELIDILYSDEEEVD